MCLSYHQEATDSLRRKIAAGKTTFYKVYRVSRVNNEGRAIQPYMGGLVTRDEQGYIHSNRTSTILSEQEMGVYEIRSGIHVYAELASDDNTSRFWLPLKVRLWDNDIQVPVTVELDDFVAANYDESQAVFTKIRVDPEKFNEAVKAKALMLADEADEDDDEDEEDYDDDEEDYEEDGDDEEDYDDEDEDDDN